MLFGAETKYLRVSPKLVAFVILLRVFPSSLGSEPAPDQLCAIDIGKRELLAPKLHFSATLDH